VNAIQSPLPRDDHHPPIEELYAELTGGGSDRIRVEALLERAATAYPGLVPGPDELEEERGRALRDKRGVELAQGRLVSALLADPRVGTHLIESMLRPRQESLELIDDYRATGRADLGAASVERQGHRGVVTVQRGARLNAENDETTVALEIAVDLVLLDPGCEVGVLRGGVTEHPRYAGRRVFSSGLDLSELYRGELSYLFFIVRELGFVAKMHRGAAVGEEWLEKPWVASVETFAIGGGAQLLLVMDRVVAERDALLSLPASREGIIPGAAALRLPAFVGISRARRAITSDRPWRADSELGRLMVDDLVDRDGAGDAVAAITEDLMAIGPVSLIANRRALRAAQEPLDAFRRYMSTYAIEQARCLTSDAMVRNLERNWINRGSEG
jgi:(3,5-dihydroxyphenyl)acetyl-CoA 1,2-dioxygenase